MSIAFKEWRIICDALQTGRQSIILRKGGIAEGRGGFSFDQPEFFLFPTLFHEQLKSVRIDPDSVDPALRESLSGEGTPEPAEVRIELFVRLERAAVLRDWAEVAALAPLHIWNEDILKDRFGWGREKSALSLALVRVYRLAEPWVLPYDKEAFGGCKSWIELPDPPSGWREDLTAAIADDAFQKVADALPAGS